MPLAGSQPTVPSVPGRPIAPPEGARPGPRTRAPSLPGEKRSSGNARPVRGRDLTDRRHDAARHYSLRMRAITIPEPGEPRRPRARRRPRPEPAARRGPRRRRGRGRQPGGRHAAQGLYDPPPGASAYPGLEVSGRIAPLGDGVHSWQPGDEVCALIDGGGYAEQVVVPAGQVLPVPAGVDLVDAAGLPEVACTVWSNVFLDRQHPAGPGAPRSRRQLGHRHDGDPARQGGRRPRRGHGRAARRSSTSAASSARTSSSTTASRTSSSDVRAANDGHGADVILDNIGREVPRPQRRRCWPSTAAW